MVGDGSWLSSAAGLWLPPKSQPPLLKFDKYSPAWHSTTDYLTKTGHPLNWRRRRDQLLHVDWSCCALDSELEASQKQN